MTSTPARDKLTAQEAVEEAGNLLARCDSRTEVFTPRDVVKGLREILSRVSTEAPTDKCHTEQSGWCETHKAFHTSPPGKLDEECERDFETTEHGFYEDSNDRGEYAAACQALARIRARLEEALATIAEMKWQQNDLACRVKESE